MNLIEDIDEGDLPFDDEQTDLQPDGEEEEEQGGTIKLLKDYPAVNEIQNMILQLGSRILHVLTCDLTVFLGVDNKESDEYNVILEYLKISAISI